MSEVSTDNIDAFNGIDETVFVAYVGPDNHAAREIFADVAKKYREEFTFGLVSDATLTKEQASGSPTITCHLKDGGTVTRTATSFTDSAAMEKFVIEASRPVVGELTKYNQQRLLDVSASPCAPSPSPQHIRQEWSKETWTDKGIRISVDGPWFTCLQGPKKIDQGSGWNYTALLKATTNR